MELRFIRNLRHGVQLCTSKQFCRELHLTTSQNINPNNVKEVQIPVPWGHIAGKWWGDTSKQPILALHGWQDNASTFDPLLELLPESLSVLAVDSPGHGFSSHFPDGMIYNNSNYIVVCRRIQNYFKWTKPMTLLGHSKGGIVALTFSALYPEFVNALITLDVVKPIPPSPSHFSNLGKYVDKSITESVKNAESNPQYSLEEIEKRWIEGTRGSLTLEAVRVLMKRGIKLDSGSGKYAFTRDPRVKMWSLYYFDEDQSLALASNIRCKFLAVKFSGGVFFDASLKNSPNYLSTLEKAAKSFEIVKVEGSHHGHLNDPERVAPVITEFLENNDLL